MVALDQHPRVDRSMGLVAGGATLADGFMFEHEWATLRDVAFATGLLFCAQGRSTANDRLAFVRVVAIAATDSRSARNRPGMRAIEDRM